MELNHLRYFYEVARRGSFTAASRTLRVSQPSISKIVASLERSQDLKLLIREPRGVRLTAEGQEVFVRCETIFGEIDRIKDSVERGRKVLRGTLSVAASDNLSNYVLPGLFQDYWRRHPEVRVRLFTGTSAAIRGEVVENGAELGVFYTHLRDRSLELEKISTVEFVIVSSPGNPKLRRNGYQPGSLRDLYYLGSRLTDYQNPYCALTMLKDLGIQPRLFFECNNQETQKRMAMLERGYTVLPRFMVTEELRSGALVQIPTPKRLGAGLYLARKKGRELSAAAREFETLMRANRYFRSF